MDIKKYRCKMLDRQMDLINQNPSTPIEKAINDLESIICDINPYSRWWRSGYIKSLKLAIAALKESEKEKEK